ncbi:hypothetical protein N9Y42_01865 [Mariniblastus sp.]|nr:hypothetical protein [Mariniblastus sp.]
MSSFDEKAWNKFKNSNQGEEALSRTLLEHADFIEEREHFRANLLVPVKDGQEVEEYKQVDLCDFISHCFRDRSVNSSEEAKELYSFIVDLGFSLVSPDDKLGDSELAFGGGSKGYEFYRNSYTNIAGLSAGLQTVFPQWFAPFFFARNFHMFSNLCQRNGIEIPALPKKGAYKARAWFYFEINEALQSFRTQNGMSPEELNAFLYEYAIEDSDFTSDGPMPEPQRAWIVSGGAVHNGDFETVDNATNEDSYPWNCSVDARRGDLVVMYCVSPRSCIHSIWRVTEDGFVDPFFYYYNTAWIGECQRISPISFKDLKENDVWEKSSFVKSNAQGKSGSELTTEEYQEIAQIAESNGAIGLLSLTSPCGS